MSKLNIGIVANEFFDKKIGRLGGFGWAARRSADVFKNHSKCNANTYFLTSEEINGENLEKLNLNGTPFIPLNGNRLQNFVKMLPYRIDILLTIDYRSTYRGVFNALPFTPIVTWVRDPRPQDVIDKMMSLKIPGKEHVQPAGLFNNKTQQLSRYTHRAFPMSKSVILANKMAHLTEVNEEVYSLPKSTFVLPNPSIVNYSSVKVKKTKRPSVLFIARLDPIKRPWLFIELAKNFPECDFYMLGKNHFEGDDGWAIVDVPDNLHIMGHVTGKEKLELLSSGWVLVNTSINEESPVSVFEAFAFEIPVISFEDWGDLVKSFGLVIGQRHGTGLEGLPDLNNALKLLITDHEMRKKKGREARKYVETEHNDETFLSSFRNICLASGIKKAAKAITV